MGTLVISIIQLGVPILGAIAAGYVLKRTFESDETMLEALGDPEAKHPAAASQQQDL